MTSTSPLEPTGERRSIASLGGQSLTEQAHAEILAAILDRTFEGRLPPEDQLARLLSVSRTTVRAALNSLEREGVVTRRRAIGTTINRHVLSSALMLQNLVGFDWLLRQQGHDVDVTVSSRPGIPDEPFIKQFDLSPDAECLLTEKAYYADGRMALWARDVIFPTAISRTPAAGEDIPASLFEFSRSYCVHPIDHAVAQFTVALKGRDDTQLPLPPLEPYMRLYESHYSADAQLMAHSVIDSDDSFIRFEVFRREQSQVRSDA